MCTLSIPSPGNTPSDKPWSPEGKRDGGGEHQEGCISLKEQRSPLSPVKKCECCVSKDIHISLFSQMNCDLFFFSHASPNNI